MIEDEDDGNAEEPIILTYRLTIEDLRTPVRGVLRLAVEDRPFLVAVTVLLSIALLANPHVPLILKLINVVGLVLAFLMAVATMRAHIQSLYRMSQKHREYRAALDAAGIHITSALMDEVEDWSMYARYAETKACFVLLRWRTGRSVLVLVIPKRGVSDPADVDRLRALLGQRLRRV